MNETYTISIPLNVVKATHSTGYFELYRAFLSKGDPPRIAYEKTEAELERYGLPGRYNCFQSFRICFGRHHRKRNQVF